MPTPPRPDDDPRPAPPERPDNDACCHSGCDPCIFDLYDEEMDRWRAGLAAWEKRHAAAREPQKPAVKRAVKRAAKAAPNPARKPKA
jgi:hypothetical protein